MTHLGQLISENISQGRDSDTWENFQSTLLLVSVELKKELVKREPI
jgi:hypothetical protein